MPASSATTDTDTHPIEYERFTMSVAYYTRQIESHNESLARTLRETIRAAEGYLGAIETFQNVPGGFDLARLGHDVETGVEVRKVLYRSLVIAERAEEECD